MTHEVHIGSQIRDLRKAKKMTIKQLASVVGCSMGYISQIERGISGVPISILKEIAAALDVQISWFFSKESIDDPKEARFIVRHDCRSILKLGDAGFVEELLSPDLKGETLLIMSEIEPGGEDPNEVIRPVEECGIVMQGELQLTIEDDVYLLQVGDSFRIPKHAPHSISNPGTDVSRTLWIITPPNY